MAYLPDQYTEVESVGNHIQIWRQTDENVTY